MRVKILLIVVLTAVCFVTGYFMGIGRGGRQAARERDVYDLDVYPHLLRLAEAGDTNLLESGIRALIVTRYNHYDMHFGSESITDTFFLKNLAYARTVVAQDKSPGPNKALEPTATVH